MIIYNDIDTEPNYSVYTIVISTAAEALSNGVR